MSENQCISEEQAAGGLAALGNQTRLRLFRTLVKAGRFGLNIGDLQQLLGVPASTMAHHLAALASADLVKQRRQGRVVICTANYETMHGLTKYLTDQCCDGIQLLVAAESG
ncbi:MAG: helix-turn-helix transcriptional regulator [Pseudomonadales bacterium]|jgi:DNA-binding transcriptional ArsR family regulator|nr:helix-turn-helix transcriptional regulator [Pseudomonadales bacterium]MDP7593992.1 helix-turn-helix transcriptional regulator [Pseudomonadales bacterium]HJN48852.1 helix-turn-helix transcriptional regulator [Pseudomonadales bacterium]|tara:strand:- start:107 stop:439 length:333 start_codon:yes stop_codon:yes gene_type:complete